MSNLISDLLFEQTPEQVLDRILSGNTHHFLGKYFTEAYLGQRLSEVDIDLDIAVAA